MSCRVERSSSGAVEAATDRRAPRCGFVLVMALAMIVLAGFLLAGVARHSFEAALDAMSARRELQVRWGTISCEKLLLDRADEIFAALESPDGEAPAPLDAARAAAIEITLGEVTFRLRLADENCKVNLNTVLRERGEEEVDRLCRASGTALRIDVRRGGEGAALRSWGEVFWLADADGGAPAPGMLADADGGAPAPGLLAEATAGVTCWGDGRLNLRRAPDENARTVGRLAASADAVRGLLSVRRRRRGEKPQKWFKALALEPRASRALARLFGDESKCFSLWIEARSAERTRTELMVLERSDDEADRYSRFVW